MKRRAFSGLLLLTILSCTRGAVPPERPVPEPTRPTPQPTPIPRPTTPTPAPIPRPDGGAPMVRIGIVVDTTAVEIVSENALQLDVGPRESGVSMNAEPGERWTFTADGATVRGQSDRGKQIGPSRETIELAPRNGGILSIAGKTYRGRAVIRPASAGKLSAINLLDMETYLRGVVPNEIGKLSPTLVEAVKAQAIAARTYAFGNMNRWGTRGFDFYATVQDQVYRGVSDEDSVANRAVEETRGEIVTFDGKPIYAYYSSTCGGRTASIRDVWPWRGNLPYLKSVPDTIGNTDGAYCQTSSRYRWTVAWTGASLRAILGETLGARARDALRIERPDPAYKIPVKRVTRVALAGRNPSGRATALLIRADGKTLSIPGDSIRWILRPENRALLNSSMLLEVNAHVEGGDVTHLEVKGGGWGHAIGMCQVGAIGRARAGQSYRQILLTYYSGTTIDRLY